MRPSLVWVITRFEYNVGEQVLGVDTSWERAAHAIGRRVGKLALKWGHQGPDSDGFERYDADIDGSYGYVLHGCPVGKVRQ